MSHDHRTPRRVRPSVTGLERTAQQVLDIRPREDYFEAPLSLAEGLAYWLDEIGWVIDPPIPEPIRQQLLAEIALHEQDPVNNPEPNIPSFVKQNVSEPGVKAEFNKNVTWGLTFGELAPENDSQLSIVSFVSDGGTYQGRARGNSAFQLALVQVLVDSVRPKIAMDVAMRLFTLFRIRPGFTIHEGRRDPYSGKLRKIRLPVFSVRQALPMAEPTFAQVGVNEERSQVVFRLQVKYLRY